MSDETRVVFKYFSSSSPQLTTDEISLLAEYCQHCINAPCWDDQPIHFLVLARLASGLMTVLKLRSTLFEGFKKWLSNAY